MRIGIARVAAETDTFSPILVDMETLEVEGIPRGQDVLTEVALWSAIPGFLDVVGNEDLVGILSAHAMPAGPLTKEAMDTVLALFAEDLRKALPLDGLLLSLHGAFAGVADSDVEGLVIQKAREIVGNAVPIAAAMDLHACITRRKIENADIIRGYHTHPHVDGRETAQKVAKMLVAAVRGETRPVISAVKIPMITPAETQLSEQYPLKELMDLTRRQEEDKRVLSSSIFAVQPWMDVPEMGWCGVVVTDGDRELGDRLARELAEMAWNQKEAYIQPVPSYREALDEAFATDLRPVVVSDFADMTTGGGTGDSTWYLKELLSRQPAEPCFLSVVDPQAVKRMAQAGAGAEVTLSLGGKRDNQYSTPVEVTGRVLHVLAPSPVRELPPTMGLAGVLQVGNLYIVVSARLGPGSRPVIYSGAGLNLAQAKILVAKSVTDFREGYEHVAKRFLLGEAPGLCPSNLRLLNWQRVPRPIFPLDDQFSWSSTGAPVYRSHPGQ